MDLVTGALGMLPSKLLELLKEEYKLQKGVRVQVQSLSRELETIHAAIRKVAAVPWDQLDEQVKVWAREVREASYDMEDILDTFLVRVEVEGHGHGHEQPTTDLSMLKRAIKKMGELFSKGKARHDISCAIGDIKKQIQEVTERHSRYKVDDLAAVFAATTSIDPRLSALYTKVSQLVGIKEPKDKVINMLASAGGEDSMETKIVSIVGFGGLGKTTLARAVYENLSHDFHFKAFIPVGQNPDLKKVLKDILIGLDKQRYRSVEFNLTILDERQLIDELREFLKDKRYFIVIDDIWDLPSWNIIRHALDDNSSGSKIVITTRKHDVAENVGCPYNMEPLSYESSKILFYERIFGSEDKCPIQYAEVSEKITKKCGGVPLAIITTSCLLANKMGNLKEWYELCDSIGSGLGTNHNMENMRKILSLSYYDLPPHLKTCLLYLSIFPEDYVIDRDRLIWRWIAEDFIPHAEGGHSSFELGDSYFNELINRSLIQPVSMDEEGRPEACRVHDMVLDLICCVSREENFVTTVLGDTKQYIHCWRSHVHRLSLHNNTTTWPTMDMPKLRSFTIFNDAIISSMPILSCHHLLRVLDLEGCNLEDHPNLSFIGKLFHLRYLGLSETRYPGELPAEMGKLQFLQTLNLARTDTKELPSTIVVLRNLMCLNLNWTICLPIGLLRNLASLEVLQHAVVDSEHVAEELGQLTQLRILTVELNMEAPCGQSICKALIESLGKLQKLRHLVVTSGVVELTFPNCPYRTTKPKPSYLCISSKASSLPAWIKPGSHLLLSYLHITVAQMRREDFQALGMLQALRSLHVMIPGGDILMQVPERFTVGTDAFPSAIDCRFYGFSVVPSMFPQGAMPRLEIFCFSICREDFAKGEFTTDDDLSLGHLPSLRTACVSLYCKKEMAEEELVMKMKEKLRQEEDIHPNRPSIVTTTRYLYN